MFRVGQRVTLKYRPAWKYLGDWGRHKKGDPFDEGPRYGEVYEIVSIRDVGYGPELAFPEWDAGFDAREFRPVVTPEDFVDEKNIVEVPIDLVGARVL
jgi:hypothetical protein